MAENYIPHHFQDDEESSMTFAELWDMFWSYKWWYAVCVFVCMACVALYIYKTPDMYVRTAKVIIDESEQDATLRSLGAVTGGAVRMRSNASVANEMEAFASPDLMQMVVSRLSLENRVTPKTPPVFLWATANDDCVPAHNSLVMAKACISNKVPVELHMYDEGPHGLSTCDKATGWHESFYLDNCRRWIKLSVEFLNKYMNV